MTEVSDTFACFGSACSVFVSGDGATLSALDAVTATRASLLDWHARFSRFEPGSELSALNADSREVVPAGGVMREFLRAVVGAAGETDGLVDATLLGEIKAAGYRATLGEPVPLKAALAAAPVRCPARGASASRWDAVTVDDDAGTVSRPAGLGFDTGGLAKGLFADLLAARLATHDSFAVDCGGDVRVGGAGRVRREVRVASPFGDGAQLHDFTLVDAGVATSGIGRRSWLGVTGEPAHHLLDPSTGRPAFTGVVQATAVAPTALEAEVRAKAAVLSGPGGALTWLADGGVVVYDDGSHHVVGGALVDRFGDAMGTQLSLSAFSQPALGELPHGCGRLLFIGSARRRLSRTKGAISNEPQQEQASTHRALRMCRARHHRRHRRLDGSIEQQHDREEVDDDCKGEGPRRR